MDFFWNDPSRGASNKHTDASSFVQQSNTPKIKHGLSKGYPSLQDHQNDHSAEKKTNAERSSAGSLTSSIFNGPPGSTSTGIQKMMTDSLIEKLIKMALPPSSELAIESIEHRVASSKGRPGLSVPIMSRNFIAMNSRLSIPFIIIDEIIKIINWTNPYYTLSILFLYTFLICKPVTTIFVTPILYIVFGIMVPQYIYLHTPDPNPLLSNNMTPSQGPPLRKVELPKPVPELSQEFLLNLTDLQNHMVLYVYLYDFIDYILCKFAFFKNGQVSSFAFIVLLSIGIFNFLFIENLFQFLLPFIKLTLVLTGWIISAQLHPTNRDKLLSKLNSEETRLKILSISNKYEHKINEYLKFVEARENKLVYIYEIQKYIPKHKEWHLIGFTSDDFSLLSNLRINGIRIEDVTLKSLDDIKPPVEWEWLSNRKKNHASNWTIDLNPEKWVGDRYIQYVEIDSETKWVYDVDLTGERGHYRRRMWTNICTRKTRSDVNTNPMNVQRGTVRTGKSLMNHKENRMSDVNSFDTDTIVEEVVNPLRGHMIYPNRVIQGVSRGSMSGFAHLNSDSSHKNNNNNNNNNSIETDNDDMNESGEQGPPLYANDSVGPFGDFADILNSSL
ncbi:Pex29p NDAI_0H00920 [Naumovozyma dairenensis CBS 421]|uniref:TECPR1-like DysF domain-containing protein n=1 Tax=Naumovozyma dairenensis (strain ATCC 10597 / BCRC 20456 / CBS 421 / NBRC 0211 / NRRL Y-12639) TaxID=1071378 RepID=G0WEQ5_NAUDC|nr:hypothetical protein NDAI_0H00920 [Naumovozyma dairenensis CBS 421]CCD26266.1 hypothetical protein NDAI_0H00920 [Naumovozyma dairenensis CBS 421]